MKLNTRDLFVRLLVQRGKKMIKMKLKHKMAKCGRMEKFILALLYNLYLTH